MSGVLERLEADFLKGQAAYRRGEAGPPYAQWGVYTTVKLLKRSLEALMDATEDALAPVSCEYCKEQPVEVKLTFEDEGVSYVCKGCAEREHDYVLEEAGSKFPFTPADPEWSNGDARERD